MGTFKPLMHLGAKTLLEHCVTLFNDNGIHEIIVVAGHRAEDIKAETKRLGCFHALNTQFQDGMFSSIQVGVRALSRHCDAFFLLPVDIPMVQAATVKRLVEAHDDKPFTPVYYPEHHSRRGHPPLISACLAEEILTYDGPAGMRGFLENYEDQSQTVTVEDQFILMDADTREQFFALASLSATKNTIP